MSSKILPQQIKDKTTPAVAPTTLVDQASLLKRLATVKEQHAAKRPKLVEALEKAKAEQGQDKVKCAKSLENLLKQYEADKATLLESHKLSEERQAKRVEEANKALADAESAHKKQVDEITASLDKVTPAEAPDPSRLPFVELLALPRTWRAGRGELVEEVASRGNEPLAPIARGPEYFLSCQF